jgi:hypothetical protein
MTNLLNMIALSLSLALGVRQEAISQRAVPVDRPLRARYLITTVDDFMVDVYLNGKPIPDSKRTLVQEIFGATVERIDVDVRKGDWLVFNVVNNRMRWGGAYYFAVAGCFAPNEFGFVSRLDPALWSVCDNPRDSPRFIAQKGYGRNRPPQKITQEWDQGINRMHEFAGDSWKGEPLWGSAKNTWIKVVVE